MKDAINALIDIRKQIILKAVVTDYVRTAEPVGSSILAARYQWGVKSATIRNELAELAELGYLRQPHTSSGRIPSDRGYRFYVDRLMDAVDLNSSEAESAKGRLSPHRSEVDLVIEQTCRILSDLVHYTSVATSPAVKDAVISHISAANVGKAKMLLVVVFNNGCVLHEMLEFGPGDKQIDPVRATNFLMQKLSGKSLSSVSASAMEVISNDAEDMKDLLGKVLQFLRREGESTEEADVHLEGASYIMQQPEFKDLERLEALLSVLDQRSALYKLFSSVYTRPEVTVIIGSENPVDGMQYCSFVGSTYSISGRTAGTIGIFGPTRMNYPKAVSAVDFMARNLSDMLTALSVS